MSQLLVTPVTSLELIPASPDAVLEPGKKFRPVGFIRHPDGVLLRFTQRVDNGRVSAGLFRYFREPGQSEERESVYVSLQHLEAAHRLLDKAADHMLRLEQEALARFAGRR